MVDFSRTMYYLAVMAKTDGYHIAIGINTEAPCDVQSLITQLQQYAPMRKVQVAFILLEVVEPLPHDDWSKSLDGVLISVDGRSRQTDE